MSSSSISCCVSVIIPVYNRVSKVGRAVESVQAQTHRNWEIVIVDDGSSDGTPALLAALAREDARVRVIRHQRNLGAQAARNTGIRAAQGEWIAFLDSDDEWFPDSLEKRLKVARDESLEVVHSECFVVREGGQGQLFRVPPMAGSIYRDILSRPGPMFQALLVSVEAMKRIGYLDEQITAYQEWDTSIRLAKHYRFGFVAEPTFIYDCRGIDTISRSKIRDAIGYEYVVRKHAFSILCHAGTSTLSQHYQQAAARYMRAGDKWNTWRCRMMALLFGVLSPRQAALIIKARLRRMK